MLLGSIASHVLAILSIVILAVVFPGFNLFTIASDFGKTVVVFTTIALSGIPTAVAFWPLSFYGLVSSTRTYLVGVSAFITTLGLLVVFDGINMNKTELLAVFSCLIVLLQVAFWYLIGLIDNSENNQSIESGDNSINIQIGRDYHSK